MTLPRAYFRKFEPGFTLIEILVVIGALAFVFAILTLGIRQAIGSFALRRAASITAVELRRAQAAAIAAGAGLAYTVEFVGGTGGLRVYVQGNASPVRTIAPPDEWPASVAINLASTTFLNCTAPASVTNKCVTFQPLGYASQAGTVALTGWSSVTYLISVTSATGKVSVTQQ